MSDEIKTAFRPQAVEQVLRERLAGGDMVLASTRTILCHLLANRDQALFSDEVIARVRGMNVHVARQLLFARAEADGLANPAAFADRQQDALAALLIDDAAFLAHAHVLTLEAQLAAQLQRRSGFDGVLSPLLQELTASADGELAAAAMRVIAVQARFLQAQRRMELPLAELPADLFHKALLAMRRHADDNPGAQKAEARLRSQFDESQGRLGQMTRLVMAMGRKAPRALAIDHAGLALFATALAMAAGQDRDTTVLSFGENQLARLALSLRAAGLAQDAVEEQFVYLHPDAVLPEGFDRVTADRASALLAGQAN
ncbi:hypothetical protein M3P36_12855 [Altererythrobacter sp. KTW20L]|uniref:hypothetical protein n=1 Tax=Altererythrobacter sp. KTW20L TaxID=2942210 RepID=UPI0020C09875|nr:hypothetical protein [Altererythrobacter sp. KTW20L]MCL6251929.1 hypothetical protein [Altererythrobacter sp. KTW20L]